MAQDCLQHLLSRKSLRERTSAARSCAGAYLLECPVQPERGLRHSMLRSAIERERSEADQVE